MAMFPDRTEYRDLASVAWEPSLPSDTALSLCSTYYESRLPVSQAPEQICGLNEDAYRANAAFGGSMIVVRLAPPVKTIRKVADGGDGGCW